MPKTDVFKSTFQTLRKVLKPYEKRLTVIKDKPGAYYLASKKSKTGTGSDVWFGGVEIEKNYVSFHFIPIYASPELRDELSPSLRKRMQGKSCFNFTAIDPAHVEELEAVTKKGFAGFIRQYP